MLTDLNRRVASSIGLLDYALSELKVLALLPELCEADTQTVKHHAEDCVGLGSKVLEILKEKRKPASEAVAWYDCTNDCVYTHYADAARAMAGGNSVTSMYVVKASPRQIVEDLAKSQQHATVAGDPLRVGNKVMIYDRYRLAVSLRAEVVRLADVNDGVEVRLTQAHGNSKVGDLLWVSSRQCELLQ